MYTTITKIRISNESLGNTFSDRTATHVNLKIRLTQNC